MDNQYREFPVARGNLATEVPQAFCFDTMCFFSDFFDLASLYFNQLDATSKAMYRHEIICTGNTSQFN